MAKLDAKGSNTARDAETDTYIVNRIVDVLALLKLCKTEEMHQDYYVILGACVPRLHDEMKDRVARRLEVKAAGSGTKLKPFQRSLQNRAVLDEHVRCFPFLSHVMND